MNNEKPMVIILRRIYQAIIRLHPAPFREQFGREMLLDYEDALHTYRIRILWHDALLSLARQWASHVCSPAPNLIAVPKESLLAGDYVMLHDKAFTPLELSRGLAATMVLLTLCTASLKAGPTRRPSLNLLFPVSSNAPATGSNGTPKTSTPGEGNSASQGDLSHSTNAVSAETSAVPPPPGSNATTASYNCPLTAPATQPTPELLLFHPPAPLPSYEVATIKPIKPDSARRMVRVRSGDTLSPLGIRRYIMDAFGAVYAVQVLGGPDWLSKDAYEINAKPSDGLASALQKMPRQQRIDQTRALQQSLLADRFHLHAHCETRILPVYALVPAKGGLKITAVPLPSEHKPGDPPSPITASSPLPPGSSRTMFNSKGLRTLNARAIQMQLLSRIIASDAGDRPIVDRTGFTGYFDITALTWAPLSTANEAPDASSLRVALQDTLGLKLIPTKAPIEVLVIDHIDQPSAN